MPLKVGRVLNMNDMFTRTTLAECNLLMLWTRFLLLLLVLLDLLIVFSMSSIWPGLRMRC